MDPTTGQKLDSNRYEPWEELPERCLKRVDAATEAIFQATNSIEANLATDPIKVTGQNWMCISFVSPQGRQRCSEMAMKVSGCFDTRDEAQSWAKQLNKLVPEFDVFVCSMYDWCLVPPDPEKCADQNYQDQTLHQILSEYRKNQIYAKEHFEERKREMMAQAADEARKAALEKLKQQSELEMQNAEKPLEPLENRITDITECGDSDHVNVNETVSASEIMDQMVNGCKIEESSEPVEPVAQDEDMTKLD
jgi:excinuclease UvrABC nuclease subunit